MSSLCIIVHSISSLSCSDEKSIFLAADNSVEFLSPQVFCTLQVSSSLQSEQNNAEPYTGFQQKNAILHCTFKLHSKFKLQMILFILF